MFFIFPDMFSREKTFSFLSCGLLPVPNVKSSLYRTTNTTTLVKRTKKKNTVLVMAIVLEVGVSCDPRLPQETTQVLTWKRACVR